MGEAKRLRKLMRAITRVGARDCEVKVFTLEEQDRLLIAARGGDRDARRQIAMLDTVQAHYQQVLARKSVLCFCCPTELIGQPPAFVVLTRTFANPRTGIVGALCDSCLTAPDGLDRFAAAVVRAQIVKVHHGPRDYLERLALRLDGYWHARGHPEVKHWVEPAARKKPSAATEEHFTLKSNFIDGLPPANARHPPSETVP